jgi:hypothetical protein
MSTVAAVEGALIKAGVEFIPTDGRKGERIRMATAKG